MRVFQRVQAGFTIIEMLMVIAVLAVLMSIVTTAASSSMKMSRVRKADAICALVQAGLATYHAQYGEWPVSGLENKTTDDEGDYKLSAAEVRESVRKLVKEAHDGNPVMDISGLYVSRSDEEPQKEQVNGSTRYRAPSGAYGMDFWEAVRGNKRSQKKMRVSEMYFGYPHPETGGFMRLRMSYNPAADSITVYQWDWE